MVAVEVEVDVAVSVAVAVRVTVAVTVAVGVEVGVAVGVGVGTELSVFFIRTRCGACAVVPLSSNSAVKSYSPGATAPIFNVVTIEVWVG